MRKQKNTLDNEQTKSILLSFVNCVPSPDKQKELRIQKIREILYNRVTDWRIEKRENLKNNSKQEVERELIKILPKIKEFSTLLSFWRTVQIMNGPEELIEKRMEEIVIETKSFFKLFSFINDTVPNSQPEKIIIKRVENILAKLSKDNISNDFLKALKKESFPYKLIILFEKKTRELLAE